MMIFAVKFLINDINATYITFLTHIFSLSSRINFIGKYFKLKKSIRSILEICLIDCKYYILNISF